MMVSRDLLDEIDINRKVFCYSRDSRGERSTLIVNLGLFIHTVKAVGLKNKNNNDQEHEKRLWEICPGVKGPGSKSSKPQAFLGVRSQGAL